MKGVLAMIRTEQKEAVLHLTPNPSPCGEGAAAERKVVVYG